MKIQVWLTMQCNPGPHKKVYRKTYTKSFIPRIGESFVVGDEDFEILGKIEVVIHDFDEDISIIIVTPEIYAEDEIQLFNACVKFLKETGWK